MQHADLERGSLDTPPEHGPSSAATTAPGRFGSCVVFYIDEAWQVEYSNLCTKFIKKLLQISSNVAQVQGLVRVLGSPKDSPDHRDKLNRFLEVTKDACKDANRDLHRLDQFEKLTESQKMQKLKLKADFERLLFKLRELQKSSALKAKEFIKEAKAVMQQDQDLAHCHSDAASPQEDQKPLLQRQAEEQGSSPGPRAADIAFNEALIAEREDAIKEIDQSIMEVNEIFKNLGTLVGEQQFTIDNIELNIESAYGFTSGATSQLRKANKNQRHAGKKLCFMLFLLVVIAFVVMLILLGL